MKKEFFSLYSKFDNLPLSVLVVEPKQEAKGIIQLVHGMCEHKLRYERFMEFLAENGFICCMHDHRGHGSSVLEEEDLGYFGDRTGKAVVEDTALLTREMKKRYPALPVYLFGHSMGSLIVRCYLQEYDDEIEKLVVCGSPSKNPLCGLGLFLNGTISLFKGERHRSQMMSNIALDGDKKFKGEGKGAWLTRDKSVVEEYQKDAKSGFTFTCNGFANLLKLMKSTYSKKKYKVKNPSLSILFIAGSDDPVIGDEGKWISAQNSLREIGYTQVEGKLYPSMRHELLNEIGREEVWNDLLSFFQN